jgi:epoxyqueuosine reductase QueG
MSLYERTYVALDPLMRRLMTPKLFQRLWVCPPLPRPLRYRVSPPLRPWEPVEPATDDRLKTVAGIERNPEAQEVAERDVPLHDWTAAHTDTVNFILRHGWGYYLLSGGRTMRARRKAMRVAAEPLGNGSAPKLGPEELTAALKDEARRLGISAIGVAPYDEKYTYVEHRQKMVGDVMVVCAVESHWKATQTAPSVLSEKAQIQASSELISRMADLGTFLKRHGYDVKPHTNGDGMSLHYAVEAGLGQMGLNGQVLTPQAGSRARIGVMNTNAPLVFDSPVDYGIHAICDACQVCVRRCPSGAITNRRQEHRGVVKAKIKTERCAPVVAQAHHCAACMKVCPVQRYGLESVRQRFLETGKILGKDTDELEAYTFQGRVYKAGERPKLNAQWFAHVPYSDGPDASKEKNPFELT